MFSERKGSQVPTAFAAQPPFASLSFALTGGKKQVSFGLPLASISCCSHDFGRGCTEPATGVSYPPELCVLTKKNCPQLAGAGVRAKRILGLKNINVYTVGLYVDGHGAKKALHKYKGSDVDLIMDSQALFDELVENTHFEKSLRLVISFGSLKRAQFVSALQERLKPALAKAKEPASTMQAFESLFDGVQFSKGLEVAFATHHKGQLVTQIGGKQVGTIQSPALVKALFDIYVGPDPVSSDAKRSIAQGLECLLND